MFGDDTSVARGRALATGTGQKENSSLEKFEREQKKHLRSLGYQLEVFIPIQLLEKTCVQHRCEDRINRHILRKQTVPLWCDSW